jgi:hypothetical protein
MDHPLNSRVEMLPAGTLVVAFSGNAGVGSAGNDHGRQMSEVINQILAEHRPSHLLIDLRGLEYAFGDWIVSPMISAAKLIRPGRVCIVAEGKSWENLQALWELGANRLVPMMSNIDDALPKLGAER